MISKAATAHQTRGVVRGGCEQSATWFLPTRTRARARRSQSRSRAYVQHRESSSSATKPEVGVGKYLAVWYIYRYTRFERIN